MDQNTTYIHEVDLKDLIFYVLRKWKPILLVAILFAVLLGGYKGFSTYQSKTSASALEAAETKYEANLIAYERSKESLEHEIENLKNAIVGKEEYLDNSVWLQTNPYEVYEASVVLYVNAESINVPTAEYPVVDNTESLLQVYKSLLTSNAPMTKIAEALGIETKYLKELVTVTVDAEANQANRILTISVKHNNGEDAELVLDSVLAGLNNLSAQVTEIVGTHTVHMVSRDLNVGENLELAELLKNHTTQLTELTNNLAAKEAELAALVVPVKTSFSLTSVVKPSVKFAVVGGVLGAFMVAFGACVMFLMSDKVYSSKELKNRCGVKVLGALPAKTCKCPIDALLNRLEGREIEANEAVRNGLIAQNIRNGLGDVKELLVAGNADIVHVDAVVKALEAELPEIKVVAGGNLLKDVNALKKLPDCDGVVLVEACGVSLYGDIALEIEKARDLGKSVVGCVVIG